MYIKENLSLIVITLICCFFSIYEPLIFEFNNISNILKQASLIAIFSIAQSVVLITKGLDLSQGGIITVVSVSVALLSSQLNIPVAIGIGLLIGGLIGFFNGMIISNFKVSPFVVTLGVGTLFQGVALVLSQGQPIYQVPEGFSYIGWNETLRVPDIVYVLAVVSICLNFYLSNIIYGRYLFAIGSNERASYLSGINITKHKVIAYTICGLITSLGAMILASRINSGHPVEGVNTALQSVAACVIGGVSLFGGKGKVLGVILGSLLLAFISNSLNIINVSSYYQQIMVGIIIIFAVIIDKLKSRTYEESI
ncbi:ABC transporter permease [Methylomonas sp. LWB]|uniref:ABC transporter permease n=1 Tax=Methylomonas sp. LWB TaxID=1905845 RepID=UPI0009F1CF68|nr:ABC transporter permease [Methylomonas sp. LWB]